MVIFNLYGEQWKLFQQERDPEQQRAAEGVLQQSFKIVYLKIV